MFFRKNTLSRDYYIFAAIVALAVIAFSLIRAYDAYLTLNRDKELRYHAEGEKIANELEESFNYLESFLSLVGAEISHVKNQDPEKIAQILRRAWPRIGNSGYNYFTWSVLDFTNPKGMIVASSMHGVLNPPQPQPPQRRWLSEAPKNPGRVIFSEPDVGILTKKYILPAGYGIVDQNGKFIGSVSIGFALSNLVKKLESPLNYKSASFVVLDENKRIITQSSDNPNKINRDYFTDKINAQILGDEKGGMLETPLEMENVSYNYYQRIDGYPFLVLLGDNKSYLDKEFNQLLMPRIEQSAILGIFFLVLLYFFQRKIIKPVTRLSDAALAISEGKTDVEIPETDIYEYQVLATKLRNVQDFVGRLNNAQSELQEALRAKASYLSNMSHEFRTPLNAVIGFSETIKNKIFGDINEKYAEYIENINEQGQYLLELIEDILDASKIDAGKMKLDDEPFDFKRLIKESVKGIQLRADTKKLTIITEISEDLPYIRADRTKMKQVLLNLLTNAVKFTNEGGSITIRAYIREQFNLEVEDTGIGIPKDDLKKITQRFMQVENTYTKKQAGTGLGMSISKDIVELHGGKMKIKSELNKGTLVAVKLPKERIIFAEQFSSEG